MKWRVFIRPAAETDLRETRDWYEQQRLGLGDEFLASIADSLAQLEETPERFPIYHRRFHRVLTEMFPYKVFFLTEGDAVIVFRVLHASRDHVRELE